MKKYVVLALGLMASEDVFARVEPLPKEHKHLEYRYAIKLYNEVSYRESFDITSSSSQGVFRRTHETTNYLRPTFAFQWRNKRNNFHEIELNRFNIEKDYSEDRKYDINGQHIVLDGYRTITTNISVRYEYIIQFGKRKNSRLVPALGLGVNPYYLRQNFIPLTSNIFPQINAEMGFRTFLLPRLSYYFSKRFYLDLNIPLCVTDFSLLHQVIRDPSLPEHLQKYRIVELEAFPKMISARVGLGFKI